MYSPRAAANSDENSAASSWRSARQSASARSAREVSTQSTAELEHLGPAVEVPDAVAAQALEPEVGADEVAREFDHGCTGDDLTAVCNRSQARGAVDGRADEVSISGLYLTDMDRDPDPQLDISRPCRPSEASLQVGGGPHRARHIREHEEVAVALAARFDHSAVAG